MGEEGASGVLICKVCLGNSMRILRTNGGISDFILHLAKIESH